MMFATWPDWLKTVLISLVSGLLGVGGTVGAQKALGAPESKTAAPAPITVNISAVELRRLAGCEVVSTKRAAQPAPSVLGFVTK